MPPGPPQQVIGENEELSNFAQTLIREMGPGISSDTERAAYSGTHEILISF